MDVEIVVLPQLAAGSTQWHEAGHGVGSGGKGREHGRNCCKPLLLPNTSQNHSLSATERFNKYLAAEICPL